MDWMTLFCELWKKDRGKIIGTILGLLFALFVICFGFWQAIFIALCIFIGLSIGKAIDNNGSLKIAIIKIRERFSRTNEDDE